ncbi:fibronectin type III domain-containing protein [Aerococcus sp. Group 2]|uniref:fibronectin type III domain-containing protein n=1 Tax=Aerococcus sp. Group 2 TaxID=2976811 RepID=UPI00227A7565|nr:fibronectin type III domain-containing protein [Aerococcus sp. Group 2]MCY3036311.1 fibronectin type III domain-containing protein [Aerococcus sp. Group 2]
MKGDTDRMHWDDRIKKVGLLLTSIFVLGACAETNENSDNTSADSAVEESVASGDNGVSESSAESTDSKEGEEAEEVDPVYGEENGLDLIELQDDKPEVAPVPVNNEPNRIATNLLEETTDAMGFNWYTTDKMPDAKVKVSKSEDMSDPVEFAAEATEVTSEYAERDKDGYYIYAAAKKDEDGNFIVDENGKPEEVDGYFTDEQITTDNTQWTSEGSSLGYLELQDVTEYSYKAEADDLEADTQYYYQVGSDEGGFSKVGSFRTSGEKASLSNLSTIPIPKMLTGMLMLITRQLTGQTPFPMP